MSQNGKSCDMVSYLQHNDHNDDELFQDAWQKQVVFPMHVWVESLADWVNVTLMSSTLGPSQTGQERKLQLPLIG